MHGVRRDARCVAMLCRHHAHGDTPVLQPTGRDGDAPAPGRGARAVVASCASAAARPTVHGVRQDALGVATQCQHHAHCDDTPVRQSTGRNDAASAIATEGRALSSRVFARAQPRGHTCMASAEMRLAWRRCVITMRMATRQLCTQHDAMVLRWRPAQARARLTGREFAPGAATRPSMHVVRRDAATAQDCTLSTRDGGRTRCAGLTLSVAVCLVDCTRAQTT